MRQNLRRTGLTFCALALVLVAAQHAPTYAAGNTRRLGTISKLDGDDGMFQRVEVQPSVDVSRVRAVMVLLAPPPPADPDAKTKRRSEPA